MLAYTPYSVLLHTPINNAKRYISPGSPGETIHGWICDKPVFQRDWAITDKNNLVVPKDLEAPITVPSHNLVNFDE